jgi:hypothetical protein
MRIPLVRDGGDETPFAWWEWLLLPIIMPLLFVFLWVMGVLSVPVGFVSRLYQQREERRLRSRLATVGRFMEWAEVEAKLKAGAGTLIVEHCSPKGPVREWWTEDDLVAATPVALPASLNSLPEERQLQLLQDYAKACAVRYVDLERGTAKITEVPVPLGKRLDPRKYVVVDLGGGCITAIILVTGRKLPEKYPQGKVVTLLAWSDEPLLYTGDAESVFLTR